MAYKKTINVSIILAIMFNIIVLSAAYADWSFTLTKQTDGEGGNIYCMDLYLAEGFPTTNFGVSPTNAMAAGESYGNESAPIWGFPALSDSLALPAYAGVVNSAKLEIYLQSAAGAGEDFSFYTYAIRAGHTPDTAEATWEEYTSSNEWETDGAWGTTSDIYASRESDGTHDDSIFVDGEDAQYTKYTIWVDPDHISNEWWIMHFNYAEGSGVTVPTFRSSGYWGTDSMPVFTVYGSESAETGGGQVIIIQ